MKLSIIIPVFNEEKTIQQILERVDKLNLSDTKKEIIIIDDFSMDKTIEKIKHFIKSSHNELHLYQHKKNLGKGAAVRTGIAHAAGEYIVIQDADLEYNPQDIIRLLGRVKQGHEVVFGTRLHRLPHLSNEEKRPYFLLHYIGNRFLSLVTSLLYGQWITDMETCYKMFPREKVLAMKLESKGFEFEPEITAKLLRSGMRITEIPITTVPRGYEEGKKLNTVTDGTKAIWTLIKYRFFA